MVSSISIVHIKVVNLWLIAFNNYFVFAVDEFVRVIKLPQLIGSQLQLFSIFLINKNHGDAVFLSSLRKCHSFLDIFPYCIWTEVNNRQMTVCIYGKE